MAKMRVRWREDVFIYIKEETMNWQFAGLALNAERTSATWKFVFARFRGGICGIARWIKLKCPCFSVYALSLVR